MSDTIQEVGICKEDGCGRPVHVKMRQWCQRHYDNWWHTGSPDGRGDNKRNKWGTPPIPDKDCLQCGKRFDPSTREAIFCSRECYDENRTNHSTCKEVDCDEPVLAFGWCMKHHKRWKTHGTPNLIVRQCLDCGCDIADRGPNAERCTVHAAEHKKEVMREWEKQRPKRTTAGSSYNSWSSMTARCYQPSNRAYRSYGAVGIAVCEHWHDFKQFLEDMGERPQGTSLDRIDPEGNYEPENCRWATQAQRTANRRLSVPFVDEDWLCIVTLAESLDTAQGTKIAERIRERPGRRAALLEASS